MLGVLCVEGQRIRASQQQFCMLWWYMHRGPCMKPISLMKEYQG